MTITAAVFVLRHEATAQPSVPDSPLNTVSSEQLAITGLRLKPASRSEAIGVPITQAAVETAAREHGATEIRETMLAHVDSFLEGADFHCLCWVVSTEPQQSRFLSHPMPRSEEERKALNEGLLNPPRPDGAFRLEFTNAHTGETIFAVEGT